MNQRNTRFIGTLNANWVCGKAPGTLLLTNEGIAAYKGRGWNKIWNPTTKEWLAVNIYEFMDWPLSMDVVTYVSEEMPIPGIPDRYDWRCDSDNLDNVEIVSANTGEPIKGLFFCDTAYEIVGRYDLNENGLKRTTADGAIAIMIWEERPVRVVRKSANINE